MKKFVPILFILITQIVFAQVQSTKSPNLLLKISALPLINLTETHTLILSVESKQKNNFSLSVDAGILIHTFRPDMKNSRGWTCGIELRRYFKNNPSDYLAISYSYKDQQYDYIDSINIKGIPKYTVTHPYSKKVSMVNFIYGSQEIKIGKRFFTNLYSGIGVRFKNTKSFGLTQEEEDNRDTGDSMALPLLNWIGSHWVPNFVLNLKIGYVLVK